MSVDIDLNYAAIEREVERVANEAVQDALDAGANYWAEHARKRTGYMSRAILRAKVIGVDGSVDGYLRFMADYAGFQEFGTRYIRGMHLTNDIERVMAEAAGRG